MGGLGQVEQTQRKNLSDSRSMTATTSAKSSGGALPRAGDGPDGPDAEDIAATRPESSPPGHTDPADDYRLSPRRAVGFRWASADLEVPYRGPGPAQQLTGAVLTVKQQLADAGRRGGPGGSDARGPPLRQLGQRPVHARPRRGAPRCRRAGRGGRPQGRERSRAAWVFPV